MKVFLIAALLLFASLGAVQAQTGGPFAPRQPGSVASETAAPTPTLFGRVVVAAMRAQRQFYRKLTTALEAIRNGHGTATAAWTLILTSFLYGIFHAAGPGHGKAIITTYLATHRERILPGILLTGAASALQGLVAILIVFGLVEIAGWAARDTQGAIRWAERFSFTLVTLLGAYLCYKAVRGLWRSFTAVKSHQHHHGHDHGDHEHCGHTHIPTPDQMADARDFRTMAGIVVSIGIRPCSGAVLVLAVANLFGIAWAGVAAVAAMSLGTAIAVATLAMVVLSARHLITNLMRVEGKAVAIAGQVFALVGGGFIVVLGMTLLLGSFGPASTFGVM